MDGTLGDSALEISGNSPAYEILPGATQRGHDLLVSDDGFAYTLKVMSWCRGASRTTNSLGLGLDNKVLSTFKTLLY